MRGDRGFLVVVWSLCVMLLPGASVLHAEEAAAPPRLRPPFPLYLGQKETRIRGTSVVEGTTATIALPAALQGDVVQHDLIIPNDRDEPIELTRVTACEGCILDGHAKSIAAGGRGRVSLLLLTDAVGGQTIDGTARIETTDPDRPLIEVAVSMPVKAFAALDPYRIWIVGKAGEPIVAKGRVVPNADYPFTITDIKPRKGAWFDWSLEAITLEGRPAYEITLTSTRKKAGPYQDVLFVQTDHPARPEFKIRVEGRLEE